MASLFPIALITLIVSSSLSLACQQRCVCDAQLLHASCTRASLDSLPIMLDPELVQFRASHNRIRNLTDLANLYPRLELLELDHNQIERVESTQLAKLHQLRVLSLANNKISHIAPNAFATLRSLQQLLLNGNRLTSLLPNTFQSLRSLRRLDLAFNELTNLPSMIFHGLNQLQVLGLAANQLTFRNASLATALTPSHLPALRILDLSRNPLQLLHASFSPFSTQRPEAPSAPTSAIHSPSFGNPLQRLYRNHQLAYRLQPQAAPLQTEARPWSQLKELRMHAASLQHADAESLDTLQQLESLQMSFNDISELPSQMFSKLTSLKKLDLSGNQFVRLPDQTFSTLTALESLDLSNSSLLSELSEQSFAGLTNLQQLSFNHCPRLTSLPVSMVTTLSSLSQLSLRNTHFQYLPVELSALFSRLSLLDLSASRLHCTCAHLWLAQLIRSVQNQSLAGNQIEPSATPICSAPSELIGFSLLEVTDSHLNCDLLQPTLFAFCALLVSLLLLGGAVFACYALFSLLRRRANCLDTMATSKCHLTNLNHHQHSHHHHFNTSTTPISSLSHLFRRQSNNLYASSLAGPATFNDPKRAMKLDSTCTWLPNNTNTSYPQTTLYPNQACTYPTQLSIGSLLSSSADSTIVSGLSSNAYEVVSLTGSSTGNNVYSSPSLDSAYMGHNYASLYETCGPARPPTQPPTTNNSNATLSAPGRPLPGYLHSWNPSFDEPMNPIIGSSTLVNQRN